MSEDVSFILNGKPVSLSGDPMTRLLDALRDVFGLTGAKEGCGTGECGACTLMMDGETRLSCLTLAAQLDAGGPALAAGVGPLPIQDPLRPGPEEDAAGEAAAVVGEDARLPIAQLRRPDEPRLAAEDVVVERDEEGVVLQPGGVDLAGVLAAGIGAR